MTEEQLMQELEDKIRHALKDTATEDQVYDYIRDIHDFGDMLLYKDIDEEEIKYDYFEWSKPDY
jgi:hypothetical protein